jgi:hypothetical protein
MRCIGRLAGGFGNPPAARTRVEGRKWKILTNAMTLSGVTRRTGAEEWRNADRRVTSERDV